MGGSSARAAAGDEAGAASIIQRASGEREPYAKLLGMRRTSALLLVLALSLLGADKKKAPKPPDIEVLEAAAHRSDGKISLVGRVRNSSLRPIQGLVLVFDFMAPGRQVVTTQKGGIEEEVLDAGGEASFHMELNEPPRAVEFQVNAVDEGGRDLRVAKPGPFPIE